MISNKTIKVILIVVGVIVAVVGIIWLLIELAPLAAVNHCLPHMVNCSPMRRW